MAYKIVFAFFKLLSFLPFRLLYCLSDCGFAIIYFLVRYRRNIVRRNLVSSFPEKSLKEIEAIERRFYRWFCDYLIEAVKLLSISDKELRRRFQINNIEEVEQCFRQGQNAAAILGHYCNWEWLSCVGIALPPSRVMGLIYHPLRNQIFDRLFRQMRLSQPSAIAVPKKDILRELVRLKRDGAMSLFGYIADQGPKWENIHLWLPFLGHDTPVFTGAERIMRKMGDAVFYVSMSRPRRGYYSCTFKLITKTPAQMPEFEITKQFFRLLEADIRREPSYYLWSHNRWKRTHEEFDRRYKVENGKVVSRQQNDR